jgi:hypothetical protein
MKRPNTSNSNRFTITLQEQSGYRIRFSASSVKSLLHELHTYNLSNYFAYITDNKTQEIIYQNLYRNTFEKCNNETFICYYDKIA